MRLAIPKGGNTDGVEIKVNQKVPPMPQNAFILRVGSNDSILNILSVPQEYRVIDSENGEQIVREMTNSEKQIVDNNNIEKLKKDKKQEIRENTQSILDQGVAHPTKPNVIFGNKNHDQNNMQGLEVEAIKGTDMTGTKFKVDSIDGVKDKTYIFDDTNDFYLVAGKFKAFMKASVYSGADFYTLINDASNVNELNSIVDNRDWSSINNEANNMVLN